MAELRQNTEIDKVVLENLLQFDFLPSNRDRREGLS